MKFTYTFTCRIFHANIMQIKPPITSLFISSDEITTLHFQTPTSKHVYISNYSFILSDSCLQGRVSTPVLMHPSSKRHVKECMLDLAISYAILKSFTEIGRNFVAALCNSISLRLFIDLLSEHTHSMGSWLWDLQILCIWKDFESGYFANTNQDLFVNGFQCKLIKHPMIDTNR